MTLTAEFRPAVKPRVYRHDVYTALDLFSGFGGLTHGVKLAGFTMIMAANHNRYKVEVHEANNPEVEHWIADLVNPDSGNYHSAEDLPYADLLTAGVSCVNHSQANTQKAYQDGLSLFDMDDPEWEERVTRSERDRATATSVLQYAGKHHPRLILIECTTELQSWGYAIPGRRSVGDGTTYKWWLSEFTKLGYRYKELYLNSMFFGVPQSRDRLYICMWDQGLPTPDLEHRPVAHCHKCGAVDEARWTWKTGVPPSGSVRWARQYVYRCRTCLAEVVPPFAPSIKALDLSNLGTRIGDRKKPLAASTMARAERARQRFAQFPAVLMPAKASHGSERTLDKPMATQTSQQETALLHTGAIMQTANSYEHPGSECRTRDLAQPLWTQPSTNSTALLQPAPMAVVNYQGAPRGVDEPLPTQGGSETVGLISAAVLPFRKHTVPTVYAEPMPTVTSDQIPALISASETTIDAEEWRAYLADLDLEDLYLRMLGSHEVGRGCGFDPDFGDHQGTFTVWGSERDRVDGFGNAVSPPVGLFLGSRLYECLHGSDVAT